MSHRRWHHWDIETYVIITEAVRAEVHKKYEEWLWEVGIEDSSKLVGEIAFSFSLQRVVLCWKSRKCGDHTWLLYLESHLTKLLFNLLKFMVLTNLKLNRNVLHHFEVRHPSRYPITVIHSTDVLLDIQPTCYLQLHVSLRWRAKWMTTEPTEAPEYSLFNSSLMQQFSFSP